MNRTLFALCSLLALGACASQPANETAGSPADPWEPVNRPIYAFNNGLDKVLLRPLAKGYEFIFPQFVRTGIGNFSTNLRTPMVGINNLLQGKGSAAASDLGRFLLNSSVGVLGLFDVATEAGLDSHDEDFGQTLAVWGMPSGPYLTVPFFGPSTLRDAIATPLNIASDPLMYYENTSARDKINAVRLIDLRQRLFAAEALIKESPDRYVTLRESFLQRREYLIYDGDPPIDDDFYDDFIDDDEEF